MHKCKNCGTEFSGKFCPECGTPAPLEACPNCGAKLSPADKFCPECGKPLRAPAAPIPATVPAAATPSAAASAVTRASSPALMKFLAFLPYATAVLFGLFSVLFFLMLLGSVSSVMGMGTGSVYDYLSAGGGSSDGGFSDVFGGGMSEMTGADTVINLCTALVVLAALGAALAVCALAFRLSVPLRVKKIGNLRVCTLLNGCIFLFYFVDFLLGCILCGTVSDEITSPDAGPICVLVFALLFGLCSAGALLLQKFSPKLFPAETAALQRQKIKRRAALVKPVPPQAVKKPTYKRSVECSKDLIAPLRKYEKAKKLFIVLASLGLVIAALTWLFAAVFPYMGSRTHSLLGWALAVLYESNMGVAMICAWPIAVGLYFILGGSIGAAYYKKKKSVPKRRPERILRNKQFIVAGIVLPIVLFALNLILAGILYYLYAGETSMHYAAAPPDMLTPYLRGATILDAIITAAYLIGELPFFYHILKRGRELRLEVYPEEAAYRKYLVQRKEYKKQLAYYEEGIAWR